MGVARRVRLVGVGGICVWLYSRRWVWVESMGVAVRRYIDFLILLIPFPLLFAASLLFIHLKKCFRSCYGTLW